MKERNDACTKLMQESIDDAEFYLTSSMEILNKKFGPGYVEQHPELVAAMMQTAATANMQTIIRNMLENIEKAIDNK